MTPRSLRRRALSFQREAYIVLTVLVVAVGLPVGAVAGMTNVGALQAGPGSAFIYTDHANPADLYDYGNCTYWTALRRIQIGKPVPNSWGNAATWAVRAALDGYVVDQKPTQYAIMQTPNAAKDLGHVAFVERVDPDGTWHISEMNVVGFDEVDYKTMPASAALNYQFIHERAPS